jgi:hypothetical protein
MKRAAPRNTKPTELPLAWRDAEYAALQADAADSCDDRVSQNMFDTDDEREEVDTIMHGLEHGSH